MTYFCFFNQLELNLESRVHPTYSSLLFSYQVLHGLTELWLEESHSRIDVSGTKLLDIISVPFRPVSQLYILQTYRYTIHTYYGFLLLVGIKKLDPVDNKDIFVSVFDGPILVNSSYLYEMHKFMYEGGYTITCQVDIINDIRLQGNGLGIIFQRIKPKITDVNLANLDDTFNTSINTMRRNGIFYHNYLRVNSTDDHFVKVTFKDIRTFFGPSYNCEFGGFVLSEFWQFHHKVYGPYCTQHGTEPLVNEMKTFYSKNNYITLIIYSYTFQIDVDISFQTTTCESLTNICDAFCTDYRNQYFHRKLSVNYKLIMYSTVKSTCTVQLRVIKGCLMVQRTSYEVGSLCSVFIYVQAGMIQTTLQIQHNFRQVYKLYIKSEYNFNIKSVSALRKGHFIGIFINKIICFHKAVQNF